MQDLLAAYLLNAAWQIPLAAAGAPLVCRFAGLTPRARNRVWLAFLLAAALLPALSFKAPVARPAAAQAMAAAADLAPIEAARSPSLLSEEWQALREMAGSLAAHAAPVLMGLFALAALVVAARLIAASFAARRLLRRSRPATLAGEVTAALEAFAASHGRSAPPIRCSRDVRTPAVVGAFRPVILIPERLAVGREDLRAALLHEAAHVVRHDYAINLACEVLTLPVSWHPALIALKRGVRRSRELACDAMAAAAMASDQAYAKCLLSLARALGANPPARDAALLVGLFGRTDLEDRVMHLMNPSPAARGPLHAIRLCGAGALGAGLLATALALHVSPASAQQPVVSRTALAASAAAAPVVAIEAEPAEAAAPAAPAAPAQPAKPAPNHHRSVIISHRGVILNDDDGGHEHRWTSADGHEITIFTRTDKDLTPEQKARLEASVAQAEKEGEAARALVESPEFKAKIAKAKEAGEAARKYTESAEFKAQIAAAHAAGDAARAAGEAARKMTESPEFRAQIAQARLSGEMARKMTESPAFKARIDATRQAGEAARQMTQSPEFKASIARARAAAEHLRNEVDQLDATDEPPSRAIP
ncbi:MAG TPA: M56 family metallopeptidase [Phenylobacterium sp.]|jgi:beta-lactamase regulating signal transducer with metallopeptidase domain|uniref:M56 family metallopeptidase n=1 Tax=Phenylobacterium sp. TaxID=1871053 RepID=UPI002C76C461|nr:M56 family metallopeptidase [Phenylobacterium sp.]HXA39503.1 M56 family metallopeptidase [Phenylobacterium sp.]